jgi:hypothetical protein
MNAKLRRLRLLHLVGLLAMLAPIWSLTAPADKLPDSDRCEICSEWFTNKAYLVEDPIRQVKKHICLKCSKSKTVCSICGLAANPKTLRRLDDKRILCELDAKDAILAEQEARDIFQEVKRDIQRLLAHWKPLPDTNVTAYLVSHDDFIKEYQRRPSMDNPEKLLGLTRSQSDDGTNYMHRIYLLSGTRKPQFLATCAHEYTHAWLQEHSTPARTLNKDTTEGFCELMAWKYITGKNDKIEVTRILENEYTRGQIDALIAADQRYQFHRVIDWIHLGVDSWLDKDKLERLLLLKEEPEPETPAVPLWQQTTMRTPVPAVLTLRGIFANGSRRFALVNDRTLEGNEEAKVRLGATNVLVRCLEIRDASVLLRVAGSNAPVELTLAPAKTKR